MSSNTISSTILLLIISLSMITSTLVKCISNVTVVTQSNFTSLYYNMTFMSCACSVVQQNLSAFQYNTNNSTCLTFDNTTILTIQPTVGFRFCFLNDITAVNQTIQMTTSMTPMIQQAVTWYTSTTNNNNNVDEYIHLQNNVVLTFLSISITVPHTFFEINPSSWHDCWTNTVNKTINQTSSAFIYTFQLVDGQTIIVGNWTFAIQFGLSIPTRSTLNDTYYSIETESNGTNRTTFVGYF